MKILTAGITESVESILSEKLGPDTWQNAVGDCKSRGQTLLRLSNPDKEKHLIGRQRIDTTRGYDFIKYNTLFT